MAKTWVLDAETKGTGAHIAPLTRRASSAPAELALVHLHPGVPQAGEGETAHADAPAPKRFKVLDVLTQQTLAEDVSAVDAVRALASLRSPLDAFVYVRDDGTARWRMLTLDDTRTLFALRKRA
jgi:hypothetical protein